MFHLTAFRSKSHTCTRADQDLNPFVYLHCVFRCSAQWSWLCAAQDGYDGRADRHNSGQTQHRTGAPYIGHPATAGSTGATRSHVVTVCVVCCSDVFLSVVLEQHRGLYADRHRHHRYRIV